MDRDRQLSVLFTIRVRPVPIITIPLLHDYVILVLCFTNWVAAPSHFLLRSVNFLQSRQNRIDSICPSALRQAIHPSHIVNQPLHTRTHAHTHTHTHTHVHTHTPTHVHTHIHTQLYDCYTNMQQAGRQVVLSSRMSKHL